MTFTHSPTSYNEPSVELQTMADRYLKQHKLNALPAEDILSRWCDHLHQQEPTLLELPVLQLVKAVVRAKHRCA